MPSARSFSREQRGAAVPQVFKLAVNNQIRLEYYFRSAKLLVRQAEVYRKNKDDRQLYTMLMRFASLLVETIPDHQDYRPDRPPPEYSRLKKLLVSQLFDELEAVKLALKLKGEEASTTWRQPESHTPDTTQLSTSSLPELDWNALSGIAAPQTPLGWANGTPAQPLDLLSGDIALPPAHSQAQPAIPTFDASLLSSYGPASNAIRERHALLPSSSRRRPAALQPTSSQALPYPTFDSTPLPPIAYGGHTVTPGQGAGSHDAAMRLQQMSLLDSPAEAHPSANLEAMLQPSPQLEMQLGPQEVQVHAQHLPLGAPSADHNCSGPEPLPPPPATADEAGGISSQRHEVREVHISMALMEDFMRYALSNTKKGIESCGILSGVLDSKRDIFTINALIVPKQEGSSDMVSALNEEEIFEAQFSRSLYPLGWIHTHPTQTCFLSSIDIHTHAAYQIVLPEAVAIVMAPRDSRKRCGIFRLSTPGGLELIKNCPQRGFHMHPTPDTGQPIYEICGHVFLNPRIQHEVVDLR